MLLLFIISILSSNAVTLRRVKSILYVRLAITSLISCFILCINSFYTDFHVKGLSFLDGLYQTTAISHIFHMFVNHKTYLVFICLFFYTIGIMLTNINNYVKGEKLTQKIAKIYSNLRKTLYFILDKFYFIITHYFLMIVIIVMLKLCYIYIFNFEFEDPIEHHLHYTFTMFFFISIANIYLFNYIMFKKIIKYSDGLQSITITRFFIFGLVYYLGIYLGFYPYALASITPALLYILSDIGDLFVQILKLHSITSGILEKISNSSCIAGKTRKFILANSNKYTQDINTLQSAKCKFSPKPILTSYCSNSIFNKLLSIQYKNKIGSFLGKPLFISKPLTIIGLNTNFKLVKVNLHLYARVPWSNNKVVFISTDNNFINLFKLEKYTNNFGHNQVNSIIKYEKPPIVNNSYIKLSEKENYSFNSEHNKVNSLINNNLIKDAKPPIVNNNTTINTLVSSPYDIKNNFNMQYNNNIRVHMLNQIIYDNPNLNIISNYSIELCISQLPLYDNTGTSYLVNTVKSSMLDVKQSVNEIKRFMFLQNINYVHTQDGLVITSIKDSTLLANADLRIRLGKNYVKMLIDLTIFKLIKPLENYIQYKAVATWIYKEIGENSPIMTPREIYEYAIWKANSVSENFRSVLLHKVEMFYALNVEIMEPEQDINNDSSDIMQQETREAAPSNFSNMQLEQSISSGSADIMQMDSTEAGPSNYNNLERQQNVLNPHIIHMENNNNIWLDREGFKFTSCPYLEGVHVVDGSGTITYSYLYRKLVVTGLSIEYGNSSNKNCCLEHNLARVLLAIRANSPASRLEFPPISPDIFSIIRESTTKQVNTSVALNMDLILNIIRIGNTSCNFKIDRDLVNPVYYDWVHYNDLNVYTEWVHPNRVIDGPYDNRRFDGLLYKYLPCPKLVGTHRIATSGYIEYRRHGNGVQIKAITVLNELEISEKTFLGRLRDLVLAVVFNHTTSNSVPAIYIPYSVLSPKVQDFFKARGFSDVGVDIYNPKLRFIQYEL